MTYICFHYLYRDSSNYKRHNSITFSNPDNLSLESIDTSIRKSLIDGEWFLHTDWQVPDMHFEESLLNEDHPLHEYHFVEEAVHAAENVESIDDFLSRISTKFPISPSP